MEIVYLLADFEVLPTYVSEKALYDLKSLKFHLVWLMYLTKKRMQKNLNIKFTLKVNLKVNPIGSK